MRGRTAGLRARVEQITAAASERVPVTEIRALIGKERGVLREHAKTRAEFHNLLDEFFHARVVHRRGRRERLAWNICSELPHFIDEFRDATRCPQSRNVSVSRRCGGGIERNIRLHCTGSTSRSDFELGWTLAHISAEHHELFASEHIGNSARREIADALRVFVAVVGPRSERDVRKRWTVELPRNLRDLQFHIFTRHDVGCASPREISDTIEQGDIDICADADGVDTAVVWIALLDNLANRAL